MMAVTDRTIGLRGLAAPIAAITLFGVSLSMSYPIFGLLLERMGASGAEIGANTTAAAVAMVIGAPLLPAVLRRVGIGPLMVWSALGLIALLLIAPLHQGFWYWTVIRLFYGLAGTALFFASEYWIVAVAPEMRRGRIIAIYALCVSAGFALGPALLSQIGLEGMRPFLAAASVVALGLSAILWGIAEAPPANQDRPPSPRAALRIFVTDPGVVFAVVLFGIIEFGAMALIPVWGVRSGLGETDAALLLTVFALGAMVLQMPLGWAADRFDRRWVLAVSAAGSVAAPIGMAMAGPSYLGMLLWAGLWGATSVGLYSVALTEIGARYQGTALSVANAAVILGYGVGALASPVAFGSAMDLVPPNGLMYLAAVLATAYLTLISLRIWRGRSS